MLFGIDCASVDDNGDPDWARAKADGPISFAIVRSNYGTAVDRMFKRYWDALAGLEIPRGAYLFLRFPGTEQQVGTPEEQAQAMIDTVGDLDETDLPPSLDVEFPGGRAATGLSAAEAIKRVCAAYQILKDHYGISPLIYTSGRVWSEDLDNTNVPGLLDSPLWLARYYIKEKLPAIRDAARFDNDHWAPQVPQPWGEASNWWFHQYQGDATGFPGFKSTVDINRFNPLVNGDTGERVKWVQRRLGCEETGTFDDGLQDTLQAFQTKFDLVADGIVGPRTFARLCWQKVSAD